MSAETKRKNILIVEDDEKMQKIYRDMFLAREDRYDIEIVGSGVSAFKKAREKNFDLMILDMIMEGMSGDSLVACMKEYNELSDLPVLLVSVLNPDDDDVQFVTEKENTYFLQKPITEEQLFEKIDSILKS